MAAGLRQAGRSRATPPPHSAWAGRGRVWNGERGKMQPGGEGGMGENAWGSGTGQVERGGTRSSKERVCRECAARIKDGNATRVRLGRSTSIGSGAPAAGGCWRRSTAGPKLLAAAQRAPRRARCMRLRVRHRMAHGRSHAQCSMPRMRYATGPGSTPHGGGVTPCYSHHSEKPQEATNGEVSYNQRGPLRHEPLVEQLRGVNGRDAWAGSAAAGAAGCVSQGGWVGGGGVRWVRWQMGTDATTATAPACTSCC
jgi:hypothetical protein